MRFLVVAAHSFMYDRKAVLCHHNNRYLAQLYWLLLGCATFLAKPWLVSPLTHFFFAFSSGKKMWRRHVGMKLQLWVEWESQMVSENITGFQYENKRSVGFSLLLRVAHVRVLWGLGNTDRKRDRADIWFELKHSQLSDLFEAAVCLWQLSFSRSGMKMISRRKLHSILREMLFLFYSSEDLNYLVLKYELCLRCFS